MKILWAIAPAAIALLVACGKEKPATSGAPGMDTGAKHPALEVGAAAQLDSGNSSYRAKDYAGALAHYRAAAERQPRFAAAWFGVYMAQTALGDRAAADSAMARAKELDPGMMGGHPMAGESPNGNPLPPVHPRTGAAVLPPGHAAPSPR